MGRRRPGAAVANDEIRLLRARAADEDVGRGETGGLEALRDGLGDRRRRAGRVARVDLDHLLVDRARELSLGSRAAWCDLARGALSRRARRRLRRES